MDKMTFYDAHRLFCLCLGAFLSVAIQQDGIVLKPKMTFKLVSVSATLAPLSAHVMPSSATQGSLKRQQLKPNTVKKSNNSQRTTLKIPILKNETVKQ